MLTRSDCDCDLSIATYGLYGIQYKSAHGAIATMAQSLIQQIHS